MAIQESEENHWDFVAIKANREGKMMSVFTTEIISSETDKMNEFHHWLKEEVDYQFVSYSYDQFSRFIHYVQSNYASLFPKYVIRMMKAHFWNIRSELVYKFRLSNEASMKDILHLYQMTPMKHDSDLMEEAMNVLMLVTLYRFDNSHTKKLLNPNRKKLLKEIYENYSAEQLLKEALNVGYILSIEKLEEQKYTLKAISPVSPQPNYESTHSELKVLLIEFLLSQFILKK